MQGNLKQIALPEVLQFISMGKSSGTLTVRGKDAHETTLVIDNGRIINSTSLERQRRLGDLLVHRGILKRSVLAQVLNLQRTVESDKRLGEILIERDIIHESTIREVLRLQLEEEIWNLFGLEEGEFRFDNVDHDKIGPQSVLIDIEPLLLEGTRRQDEWRKIVRQLPSDRLVPSAKRPPAGNEHLKMSATEWKILAQVNGRFPIRAIINRCGMGRFEVYQILADFLRRGIIEIRREEDVAAETVDRAAPTAGPTPVSGGKGGGLFSMFTGGSRREDAREKLVFGTPVGALGYFVSRYFEAFLAAKETKSTADDRRFLFSAWAELLMGFCRADLVVVEGTTLRTDRLERFLQAFELAESTQDVYEDSIEAVSQLLDQVYRLYASRAGERAAQKAVRELLDEVGSRTSCTYGSDFRLDQRVATVLRLAA